MSNEVLKNDTSIVLDWADVTGANKYHLQVSQVPDFSDSLLVNDNTLAVSTKSFTDGGTDDGKRWWRWRYSTDGGTTWSSWRMTGHYWLNTGAAGDVSLSAGQWALISPSTVTDKYVLGIYPLYNIVDQVIYRMRERNRAGIMLSEYLTAKAKIVWSFTDSCYISHEQMREILRFHKEIRTFFMAALISDKVNDVPVIYKMQLTEDPEFVPVSAGREDLFTGTVTGEEV